MLDELENRPGGKFLTLQCSRKLQHLHYNCKSAEEKKALRELPRQQGHSQSGVLTYDYHCDHYKPWDDAVRAVFVALAFHTGGLLHEQILHVCPCYPFEKSCHYKFHI